MSFIVTARLIARGCRSQLLFNFNAINQNICKENFFQIATPLIQKRRLSDTKEIEANKDLQQIYKGRLASKIKLLKLFSISTSLCTLAVQPYLLPKAIETGSAAAPIVVGLSLGFFSFATPLILHMFTNKYVIDIDYNDKTKSYIASTFTIIGGKKKIEFTPDDVKRPDMGQVLTNCYVKGRAMLLDVSDFSEPHHYAVIMGYDKPMDFRFEADIDDKKVVHPKSSQYQSDPNPVKEKKSVRN